MLEESLATLTWPALVGVCMMAHKVDMVHKRTSPEALRSMQKVGKDDPAGTGSTLGLEILSERRSERGHKGCLAKNLVTARTQHLLYHLECI
jgi:hypothetical protein